MKNALPWIILALIVVAIVYYFYKKSKAQQVLATDGAAPDISPILGYNADGNPIVCPNGWVAHGDGSGCKSTATGSLCALWGNATLTRCLGVPTLPPTNYAPLPPNSTYAPTSTSQIPPIIPSATLASASCLNSMPVVSLIKAYKEVGLVKRLIIKSQMADLCPEALRYLVKD